MAAALHALLPHESLHAAALIRVRYASQVQLSSTMYCAPARPRWHAQHLSSQLVTSCAQLIRKGTEGTRGRHGWHHALLVSVPLPSRAMQARGGTC